MRYFMHIFVNSVERLNSGLFCATLYIPSRTVSKLSRSTGQIFALEWGVPLFNAFFFSDLSDLWEYHQKSYFAAWKVDSLGNVFIAECMV